MIKICEYCGKEFHPHQNRRKTKYCSFSCNNKSRSANLIKLCETCGKEVPICPSEINTRRFCSLRCASKKRQTIFHKTCPTCGIDFTTKLWNKDSKKYCSIECNIRAVVKICEVCGKEFRIKKSHADGRFCCSKKCNVINQRKKIGVKNNNWKGGISTENQLARTCSTYKEWRISVYKRDHFTCVICGEHGKRINAHHVKAWKTHKELRYDISNGITLCHKCHKEVHKNQKKSAKKRYYQQIALVF